MCRDQTPTVVKVVAAALGGELETMKLLSCLATRYER
jgi:hypothetical protein